MGDDVTSLSEQVARFFVVMVKKPELALRALS